ncbi:DNA topoisomerase, putative [Leishmania panamensis]|uniref:DNA topoisomerase (ATP-hydrolyzing) n=1 Tax=Leishmania panamensis TaxID=5679 RepID=A0A088RNV6_LEIPA|nr:DNA topoisomerase, putative [Leishmania panamensis]AIN96934.1 DNA topoisomerase, putative [Leishmania panamensis]
MTDTFVEVSPAVVAVNEAEALRDEALRRMEVYVLGLLHTLLWLPVKGVSLSGTTMLAFEGGTFSSWRRHSQCAVPCELQASTRGECGATSAPPVSLPSEERASAKAPALGYGGTPTRPNDGQPVASMRALQRARHHLLLLTVLFRNVVRGDVTTQRDVYYHLVRHIPTQVVVNRTVKQLSRVLRLPRQLMGVTAGGRGYIAGWLSYRGVSLQGGGPGAAAEEGMPLPLLSADLVVSVQEIAECTAAENEEEHGFSVLLSSPISMLRGRSPQQSASSRLTAAQHRDLTSCSATDAAATGFQVSPAVCAILVVEKHAVFAQLLREGLPRLLPCVLLTAQGFPTYAARQLLAHLHTALPRAPVIGLVDYNPHGLAILAAYRWATASDALTVGSASMVESHYYAAPTLRWLGVRTAHVSRVMEKTESDNASTGGPSVKQCPRLHHYTPAPLQTSVRPWKDTGTGSRSHDNDGAVASASSCASYAPHTAENAAMASPLTSIAPLQHFTRRDAVVMTHQIERLEALLHLTASPPAAGEGLGTAVEVDEERNHNFVERPHVKRVARISVDLAAVPQRYNRLSAADLAHQADRASVVAWLNEAREMQRRSVKCEMEALYTVPYSHHFLGSASVVHAQRRGVHPAPSQFAEWVCQQILRRQYI